MKLALSIPVLLLICALLGAAVPSQGKSPDIVALQQITQAGGSLILDLDKRAYTVSELVTLASSLKFQATLTIKMGTKSLNTVQCAQIAKARPGHVIFWF